MFCSILIEDDDGWGVVEKAWGVAGNSSSSSSVTSSGTVPKIFKLVELRTYWDTL